MGPRQLFHAQPRLRKLHAMHLMVELARPRTQASVDQALREWPCQARGHVADDTGMDYSVSLLARVSLPRLPGGVCAESWILMSRVHGWGRPIQIHAHNRDFKRRANLDAAHQRCWPAAATPDMELLSIETRQ
jgi:hypothetical protein